MWDTYNKHFIFYYTLNLRIRSISIFQQPRNTVCLSPPDSQGELAHVPKVTNVCHKGQDCSSLQLHVRVQPCPFSTSREQISQWLIRTIQDRGIIWAIKLWGELKEMTLYIRTITVWKAQRLLQLIHQSWAVCLVIGRNPTRHGYHITKTKRL